MPLYLDRKPLTAAQLAAVTKKLGVTPPAAHADFLRRVNGATPKPGWVRKKRVRDEYEDTTLVTRFLRLDRVDQYCKEVAQLRRLGVADRFLQIAETNDDIVYLDAASGPGRVIVHEYVEGDYTLNARTAKRFEWFPSLAAFEAGFFDPTTEHKWLGLLVRNDPERIRAWLEDGGDPNLQTPYFPTPFEQACAHDWRLPAVKVMLEYGANVADGLAAAREAKQATVVKFLSALK